MSIEFNWKYCSPGQNRQKKTGPTRRRNLKRPSSFLFVAGSVCRKGKWPKTFFFLLLLLCSRWSASFLFIPLKSDNAPSAKLHVRGDSGGIGPAAATDGHIKMAETTSLCCCCRQGRAGPKIRNQQIPFAGWPTLNIFKRKSISLELMKFNWNLNIQDPPTFFFKGGPTDPSRFFFFLSIYLFALCTHIPRI